MVLRLILRLWWWWRRISLRILWRILLISLRWISLIVRWWWRRWITLICMILLLILLIWVLRRIALIILLVGRVLRSDLYRIGLIVGRILRW